MTSSASLYLGETTDTGGYIFRGSGNTVHEDGTKPVRRARPLAPGTYAAVAAQHSHALSAPTPASRPYAAFADIDPDAVADFIREMRQRG